MTFEYKRGINLTGTDLNRLGREGWDLVSVVGPVPFTVVRESADEVGAAETRERVVGAILAFLKRPTG